MTKRFTRDVGEEIRDAVSSRRLETLDDFKTRTGYQGCHNCEHQIEPLRMCVWAETNPQTMITYICPNWVKRGEMDEIH